MLLKPKPETPTTCAGCELWSPDRHIMTSLIGLCEKYAVMFPRHMGVCVWRDAVERQELVSAIENAYAAFKERNQRPEMKETPNAMQSPRHLQTDLDLD